MNISSTAVKGCISNCACLFCGVDTNEIVFEIVSTCSRKHDLKSKDERSHSMHDMVSEENSVYSLCNTFVCYCPTELSACSNPQYRLTKA